VPSKLTLISLCGAISFGAFVSKTEALPLINTSFHSQRSAIERIAYRRCWKREGKRVCRWVQRRRAMVQSNKDESNIPPNLGPGLGSGL
jgi:hypothetical protein